MNTQAKLIIGVLVASVVGLAVAVAVMAEGDDHRYSNSSSTPISSVTNDAGYLGMMAAMGSMDSEDVLKHMREVLGEDGYQRMLTHLRDHRNGTPMTGNTAVDQMMHTMMDGMMQNMPMGSGTVLPPGNDQHHDSPTPAATPTP